MAETAPMKNYVGEKNMRNKPRKIPVPTPKPQRPQGQHGLAKEGQMPSFVKPDVRKSKQKSWSKSN
jgi:hypothetical protein